MSINSSRDQTPQFDQSKDEGGYHQKQKVNVGENAEDVTYELCPSAHRRESFPTRELFAPLFLSVIGFSKRGFPFHTPFNAMTAGGLARSFLVDSGDFRWTFGGIRR